MVDIIKAAFPSCEQNNCMVVTTGQEVKITDVADSHCAIVENGTDIFVISNPTQKNINILYIDKCIFGKGQQHKRCDCAAFDDKKFCFIEFKKTTPEREENREDYISSATDQLYVTHEKFKEKGIDFKNYTLESWVSFADDPPVPAASTGFQNHELKFWVLYKSFFYTGNLIVFE